MAEQAAAQDPQSAGNPGTASNAVGNEGGGSLVTRLQTESAEPQDPGSKPSAGDSGQAAPAGQQEATKTGTPKSDLPGYAAAATAKLKGIPEYATHVSKFKTFDDMVSAHMELERKLGTMTTIPGPDATPEERAAFKAKVLGAPDSPEKYDLGTPDLPKGVELDESFAKASKELAHSLRLSPEDAKAIYKWAIDRSVSSLQAAQAKAQEQAAIEAADQRRRDAATVAALRKDWGSDFAKQSAATSEFIKELGKTNPSLLEDLNRTGFGNSLAGIRFFAKIAKDYRDHDFIGGEGRILGLDAAEVMFGGSMKR